MSFCNYLNECLLEAFRKYRQDPVAFCKLQNSFLYDEYVKYFLPVKNFI